MANPEKKFVVVKSEKNNEGKIIDSIIFESPDWNECFNVSMSEEHDGFEATDDWKKLVFVANKEIIGYLNI